MTFFKIIPFILVHPVLLNLYFTFNFYEIGASLVSNSGMTFWSIGRRYSIF